VNDTASACIGGAVIFLKQFLGDAPWPLVAIKPRDPGAGPDATSDIKAHTFSASPKREAMATEWIDRYNREGYNLYFAPNSLKRPLNKKAMKDDVLTVDCFWADIDPSQTATSVEIETWRAKRRQEFAGSPPGDLPAPTWIIDSGRGFWIFWRLRAPLPVDGKHGRLTASIEAYGRMIEQAFAPWADNCRNIERIARLPGTVNHKTGGIAGIVAHNHDAVYELKDFPSPAKPEVDAGEQLKSSSDHEVNLGNLPTWLRDRILRPVGEQEDHSAVFHHVVTSLFELGFCAAAIKTLLHGYPQCIPDRYWRRLEGEIARSISKASETPRPLHGENDQRPEIWVRAGEIGEAVDAAEQALIKRGGLYQHANRIVYVGEEPVFTANANEVNTSCVFECGEHALAENLAEAASFIKYDSRKRDFVVVNPPPMIVRTLLERVGRFRFPVIAAVINAPALRPDGSLLSEPGYDAATGLFFDPRGWQFPAIPECPSREDAAAALGAIDDLIRHFPFVDDADRSVAISGILTYVARQSMRSAPLHAYTAPTAGSGKSKLVDIASIIATGREAGVIAQTPSEEEMEKRIGALLLQGRSIVAIDNCSHPLAGNFLCAMLTQTTVGIRILGQSKHVKIETNVSVTATGNNLVISGDVTRRSVLSRLDPKMERPELREFDFDPTERARENRPALVAAALTIMRAFKAAGSPRQATPLGSFEDWSSTIRDALIWLGRADPVETMEHTRATDNKLDDLASVLTLWRAEIGPMVRVTCRQLVGKAEYKGELKDALMAIAGQGTTISTKRLGKWLGQNANRICNGMRVEMDGYDNGVMTWRLRSDLAATLL
jgi:hypothetical protein